METPQKLKLQDANLDQKPKRGGSVKEIILKFCVLEVLPVQSNIMADKWFNLFDEFKARCIHFTVISGKIHASQRAPMEIKNRSYCHVRVLLEQAIKHLNTFRIISNEMPASLLVVCWWYFSRSFKKLMNSEEFLITFSSNFTIPPFMSLKSLPRSLCHRYTSQFFGKI